jgi:transposase
LVLREAGVQSDDDIRDKSFRILEAVVSPLEVSPGTPRRRWSAAARERIVREAMVPGANVSAVARAHGLKPQQLFSWRRRAMAEAGTSATRDGDGKPGQPRPVVRSEPMPFVELSMETGGEDGAIDLIVGGDVTIRVGAGVSMARLQMVLRAVRST